MRKVSVLGVLILILAGTNGCKKTEPTSAKAPPSPPESQHEVLFKEMVGAMDEMSAILEGVTDDASAKAAIPKVAAANEKMQEVGKRGDALPKPSKEEEDRLEAKLKPEFDRAGKRFQTAFEQVAKKVSPQVAADLGKAMKTPTPAPKGPPPPTGASNKLEINLKIQAFKIDKLAEALEGVKDEATGKAALPTVEKLAGEIQELNAETKKITGFTKEEETRLVAKYKPDLDKANKRLDAAAKTATEKGGADFKAALAKAMAKIK